MKWSKVLGVEWDDVVKKKKKEAGRKVQLIK
jgi:hypothetical protein